MIQQFAKHHNKIQFFGYEVANLLLVAQNLWIAQGAGYGLNAETFSALCMLLGSAFIWRFDSEKRPYLLFYGGVALACGGLFLAGAGYRWTGLSVALSSLETARGGLGVLRGWTHSQQMAGTPMPWTMAFHLRVATCCLGWYCVLIDRLSRAKPGLGRFIDERPFITGTLIKAPLRLEFVGKKMLAGDWIGVLVGLSWLLLGDLALAFNDAELQAYVQQGSEGEWFRTLRAKQA